MSRSAAGTVAPILIRALRDGGILAGVVALGAALVGWFVAGTPGLLGGLFGAALSAVFLGLTALSMLIAGRVVAGDLGSPVFFGIVLGAWLLKLVLVLLLAVWLRTQPWLDPVVFFVTVVIVVIGSLIVDLFAFSRSRVPYVSDVELPGPEESSGEKP
jgi:hypothetical protein